MRAALLAVHWPAMLEQIELARASFPKFISVLLLLVGYLCFSSWIATLLFPPAIEGDEYLGDWTEATWELLVLLTTANFPKVMMPAYTAHRAYALFFVPQQGQTCRCSSQPRWQQSHVGVRSKSALAT